MIWLAVACLVVAAAIVVLPPLMKGGRVTTREATDLAVYRDRLKEVDNDFERGLISAAEADAARTEIKRRILALPKAHEASAMRGGGRAAAGLVAVGVAGVSLALYLWLGQPGLPGKPYDAAAEQEAFKLGLLQEVETMVAKLAARLEQQPNDGPGWRMLGWSYLQLGRTSEAVAALKRAVALSPDDAGLRSQLGEALMRASDGKVTAEALASFDEALKRDPKEARARFYKGLALLQAGKDKEALDVWLAVIRDAPADAEWLPALRAQAEGLALKLKLDPKAATQ